MVAQNSWKTQDIDGQEVRFTHAPIADTTDSTVHIMGTLELDGEWHDVVAEIVVTATGASTEHKVEARPTAEVKRPSAFAIEGAVAMATWIAERYHEVHIARTLVAVAA